MGLAAARLSRQEHIGARHIPTFFKNSVNQVLYNADSAPIIPPDCS
jgi:hypothetical protein